MTNFLGPSMLSSALIIYCFSACSTESFSFLSKGSALKEESRHMKNCTLTDKYSCGEKSTKLVCSTKWNNGTGQCICERGHVYEDFTEKCLPVASRILKSFCFHDSQCIAGDWGSNSRCYKGKCECFDVETHGETEMVFEDGECRVKKIECEENFIFSSALRKCLPVALKYGDACEINQQCQVGPLGNLSRCFMDKGESVGYCECYSENGTTAYYPLPPKCYMRKQYNESCTENNECKASLGRRVKCELRKDSENYNRFVCYCPTGIVCRSDAALEYLRGLQISGGGQFKYNVHLTISLLTIYLTSLFF